jgi:hypothetical protein
MTAKQDSLWTQGNNVPKQKIGEFEVRLKNGSVRRVKCGNFGFALGFTDCTHPTQNAFCDDDDIVAWRDINNSKEHS